MLVDAVPTAAPPSMLPIAELPKPSKRILPDQSALSLDKNWKDLLPQLLDPYLHYEASTIGSVVVPISGARSNCEILDCMSKVYKITCIYFDCESALATMQDDVLILCKRS
jgi:hypothetical protein